MSNGTGAIGDYMFDDIRKLDFGSKFSKDFAGVTLPTVEEYLECMKKSDKLSVMNIEIKPNKSEREDIVRKTIEAVKDYGLFDELLISSFDYKMLVEAKKYDPSARRVSLSDLRPGSQKMVLPASAPRAENRLRRTASA